MEPVKFEEHIKRQLQKREIKPSAESWDKLEARLEQGKNPSRPKSWWIGIAAAIAGIFFFLGTLFNNPAEPVIVEQTSEEILPEKKFETPEPQIVIASEKAEKQEVLTPDALPKKNRIRKTETSIAVQEEPIENAIFEPEEIEVVPVTKTQKAVAEVTVTPAAVSDAEVDALLNAAMAELEQNSSSYAVQPINAEGLLHEVEYELEQNFRQKIFEVLKEGFTKARSAVANRN